MPAPRFNPYETDLSPSSVHNLTKLWNFASSSSVLPCPAVANGVVYVGENDEHVYAFNAFTGANYGASGHADLPHPALQSTDSLRGGRLDVRPPEADSAPASDSFALTSSRPVASEGRRNHLGHRLGGESCGAPSKVADYGKVPKAR